MQIKCILLVIQSLVAINHAAPIENTSSNHRADDDIIGQLCNSTCGDRFSHIICNDGTKLCECSAAFPVYLSRIKECVKSALLGEQCMHIESCAYNDPFSICSQINHKAYCRCMEGYHEVKFSSSKNLIAKNICYKDLFQEGKNKSNLLLILGGVVGFSILIGFVLKLYVNKSHPHENTIGAGTRVLSAPEIVQVARSLQQVNRRATSSRRRSRGISVSSSRATAAQAAAIILVSCHLPTQNSPRSLGECSVTENSNQNSPRSFGARQFKRENDAKVVRSQRMGHKSSRSSLEQCSSQSNGDNTSRNLE